MNVRLPHYETRLAYRVGEEQGESWQGSTHTSPEAMIAMLQQKP